MSTELAPMCAKHEALIHRTATVTEWRQGDVTFPKSIARDFGARDCYPLWSFAKGRRRHGTEPLVVAEAKAGRNIGCVHDGTF